MKNLINAIQILEDKRDNGTITMNEEVMLNHLVELVEEKMNTNNLKIV